jgi:hypothetical protein
MRSTVSRKNNKMDLPGFKCEDMKWNYTIRIETTEDFYDYDYDDDDDDVFWYESTLAD